MNTVAGKKYHSIIIGGGHNGLVCAATLARAGKSVLVLESASEFGGAARNREFTPGFRVSAAAHLVHALSSEVMDELQLASHGLSFAGTSMATHSLATDGKSLRLDASTLAGAALSPADAAAYTRFTATMNRYATALLPILRMVPPRLVLDTLSQGLVFAKIGWQIRRLGRADMRDLLRVIGMNIHDLLDEYFESPQVKGAIALDATLGAEWGPRSPGTVLTYLYRLSGMAGSKGLGLAQPKGGMGAICSALSASAAESGVELRSSARVRRILVESDRACGVELESGETIRGENIISNADPRTTFLKLLGPAHLDTGFVRKVHHLRASGRAGKLHLAMSELPKFTGIPATALGDRLLIAPTMDYLERSFNPSKYREYPTEPALELCIPTVRDGSLAPAGRHVLSAVVQFLPYDDSAERDANRAACLESILVTLEGYAPGLRALVTHAELLTPFDIEQEFGMSGGHWHHAAMGFDQFFFIRPVPGAAQYRTPVDGLYLCGAGCHPGGGVMGIAGRNAAHQVLRGGN